MTIFELWKFLKLDPTIVYTVLYHLRIGVVDLPKFFIFTLREKSRNAGFLWSVFSRIWTESYRIYGKIRIRESPYFGIFHVMSNTVTKKFFSQSCNIFAFWYEKKASKIVKGFYTSILHIKKRKCCGNEIV